jgi:hypothetical protein
VIALPSLLQNLWLSQLYSLLTKGIDLGRGLWLLEGGLARCRPRYLQPMATFPTAPIVAAGLVGGFAAARYTGRRELGGAVLAAAGALCGRSWLRSSGPGVMGLLIGVYAAAFGGSHPLAKKIGAWPSVLAVTAVASGITYALADRSSASF